MPSAELIGLQAPKKAHRSLVFALAAGCRQIESAAEIAVQAPLERGPLYKLEPIITLTSLKRRDPCCTPRDVGAAFLECGGKHSATPLCSASRVQLALNVPGDHSLWKSAVVASLCRRSLKGPC